MIAKRHHDGKKVELRWGEGICGIQFDWIKLTAEDRLQLFSESKVERGNCLKWLEHVMHCRMYRPIKKAK